MIVFEAVQTTTGSRNGRCMKGGDEQNRTPRAIAYNFFV